MLNRLKKETTFNKIRDFEGVYWKHRWKISMFIPQFFGVWRNFNVFTLFRNCLPLEKGVALYFNKSEPPSPRDALCQVWLKLAQWFLRRRWKCVKFTDRRTDGRQTTGDQKLAHYVTLCLQHRVASGFTSGLTFWYVTLEAMWYMYNVANDRWIACQDNPVHVDIIYVASRGQKYTTIETFYITIQMIYLT